jgi:hypothetical protein
MIDQERSQAKDKGNVMKTVGAMIVFLLLVGCASAGNQEAEPFVRSAGPVQPAPNPAVPPNLSPAAKSAAPSTASNGGLMECVTNSCKTNCSPNVPAAARPKWCAYFKEP